MEMTANGTLGRETEARLALVGALMEEFRRTSAYSVLFSQAVAGRLGVNSTDMECADLLFLNGPMTAGRLAELTGLTTGAITGVINRLERRGWVRREADPTDRRRVIIRTLDVANDEAHALFGGMAEGATALLAGYSDAELALFLDFLRRTSALGLAQTQQLRDLPPAPR
jgi:DNA-binding MarR family transcriptional regulator